MIEYSIVTTEQPRNEHGQVRTYILVTHTSRDEAKVRGILEWLTTTRLEELEADAAAEAALGKEATTNRARYFLAEARRRSYRLVRREVGPWEDVE